MILVLLDEFLARYDKRHLDVIISKICFSLHYDQFIKLRSIAVSMVQYKKRHLIEINLVLELIINKFFEETLFQKLCPSFLDDKSHEENYYICKM